MTAVSTLLKDIDQAMATRSDEQRAGTMASVARMFATQAAAFSDDQVDLFDAVIGRLAANASPQSRVDLSETMADVPNAPRGVVRQLAMDQIHVARPVLTRSPRLTDQDLIAVAAARGRDHMVAMTERPHLTTPVTDYLVVKGDSVVSYGLASNQTARFSDRGMGLLVTRATSDDVLQGALGQRTDIPDKLITTLNVAARDSARKRLTERPSPVVVMAAAVPAAADQARIDALEKAAVMIADLAGSGRLTEQRVASFAGQKALAETVCALSAMANLSTETIEQMVLGADRDALIVIARAMNWGWSTARALLSLRPAQEQLPHLIDRAKASFENLSPATAQRVVQFMRVKDRAGLG